MAEKELDGEYSILCGLGQFSYITTTDEYCQEKVNGITCYLFKQNSDDSLVESHR